MTTKDCPHEEHKKLNLGVGQDQNGKAVYMYIEVCSACGAWVSKESTLKDEKMPPEFDPHNIENWLEGGPFYMPPASVDEDTNYAANPETKTTFASPFAVYGLPPISEDTS